MPERVRVRSDILERMIREAQRVPEEECCGLLAGRAGIISEIYPAQNMLKSSSAFEIAPKELFESFRRMRATGLEHLGIYHSHPRGDNAPSRRDVERAYYPEAAYFIIATSGGTGRRVRAFSIRNGRAAELEIEPV